MRFTFIITTHRSPLSLSIITFNSPATSHSKTRHHSASSSFIILAVLHYRYPSSRPSYPLIHFTYLYNFVLELSAPFVYVSTYHYSLIKERRFYNKYFQPKLGSFSTPMNFLPGTLPLHAHFKSSPLSTVAVRGHGCRETHARRAPSRGSDRARRRMQHVSAIN